MAYLFCITLGYCYAFCHNLITASHLSLLFVFIYACVILFRLAEFPIDSISHFLCYCSEYWLIFMLSLASWNMVNFPPIKLWFMSVDYLTVHHYSYWNHNCLLSFWSLFNINWLISLEAYWLTCNFLALLDVTECLHQARQYYCSLRAEVIYISYAYCAWERIMRSTVQYIAAPLNSFLCTVWSLYIHSHLALCHNQNIVYVVQCWFYFLSWMLIKYLMDCNNTSLV